MENKPNKAYYFSHDSNARNDEKILKMRMELGMIGYAVFWCILEKMRETTDNMCSKDYKIIGFELRVDEEIIRKVVEDFGLFTESSCGKKFYSESFMNRMQKMNLKSEKARESANARWTKRSKTDVNANAMQTHSEGNAIKERKGKEIKIKEIENKESKESSRFSPPSQADVLEYMIKEKKINQGLAQKESTKFVDFYSSKGWLIGKTKMKNWKSAVSGWINRMDNFGKENVIPNGSKVMEKMKRYE